MTKFRSKYKHPVVVIKSLKTDRDGEVKQEGRYVYFENFTFETDDQELIDGLRRLKNFSPKYDPLADYCEVQEADVIQEKKEYPRPTVISMPSDDTKENDRELITNLSSRIDKLTSIVAALVEDKVKNEEKTEESIEVKKRGRPAKE